MVAAKLLIWSEWLLILSGCVLTAYGMVQYAEQLSAAVLHLPLVTWLAEPTLDLDFLSQLSQRL